MAMTLEILTERVTTLEKQIAQLLSNSDPEPKKEKKAKKAKKDAASSDDEEKPKKKRVSGYILFSNANRDDVKDKLADGDEKPKNTEVMKELAKLWKALGDEEKEVWNTKAKELKDEA
jgi:upstream-binding transcription factor